MLTMMADCQVTRRQRMTHITDQAGTLRWSGPTVSAGLRWLVENNEHEVRFETDDDTYIVNLAVCQD